MSRHNRDDDSGSDTDWDSIYNEEPAEEGHEQPRVSQGPPSQGPLSASTKAREAAEERREDSTPQTSSSHGQRSSQPASTWASEETPLLDAGPPPPAYSDVARSPYRSGNNVPQSMEDGVDVEGGETGRGNAGHPVKKRGRYRRWKGPRMLLKLAILILGIVFIATVVGTTWRDGNHNNKGDKHHTDDGDDDDYRPVVPPNSDWWNSPRLQHCQFDHMSVNHFFEFASPKSFSFLELMESDHLSSVEVDGVVKVTAAAAKQEAAIVVGITLATSKHYEISQFHVKQTGDSLSLRAPSLNSTGSGFGEACMMVVVTITIRPDADISDFEIATQHLNLIVDSSFSEKGNRPRIRKSTEFTTIRGNVSVASWSSRSTIIDVVSGSVSGKYELRDLLSIKTRSGSISVDVEPQPVDPTLPAPAAFTATSISGTIKARFPTSGNKDDIPARDYRTRVETNSGAISGSYLLGSSSTFKTTSGAISADVLPYAADLFASSLKSETYSGHTTINLLSPFRNEGKPITRLQSIHKSTSSGITLVYPQEWEGLISGDTLSGSLTVKGKDVKVINYRDGPVGKKITAKKGDGHSKLDFSALSGSVAVTVGDTY